MNYALCIIRKAFPANTGDSNRKILTLEIRSLKPHHMSCDMGIRHLTDLPASLAHKMDMIIAAHLIDSAILSENILAEDSRLFQKFHRIIYSGPAHMISVTLDRSMQSLDLEMGIHIKSLPENSESFRSLSVLPVVEKLRKSALNIVNVKSGHTANLIIRTDISKQNPRKK